MQRLKKFLTIIFLTIILSMGACKLLSLMNLSINNDSGQIRGNLELLAPSGTTNDSNPYQSLVSLWIIDKGDGWSRIHNYYNDSNLEYTFNGIQLVGDRYYINTGGDVWYLAIDLEFDDSVQFNRVNAFSIILHRSALLNTQLTSQYTNDGVNWYNGVTSVYSDGDNVITTIYPNTVSASAKIIRLHFDVTSSTNTPLLISSYYGVTGGQSAYDSGYQIGSQEGYTQGYDEGYTKGYNDSTVLGISNPEHIFYAAFSLFSLFGDLFLQLFTTPIWGELTIGFVFVILPFSFKLIEIIIHIVVKLIKLGG